MESPSEKEPKSVSGPEQAPAFANNEERLQKLFEVPLSSEAPAFKKMWEDVDAFASDKKKWSKDPFLRNFFEDKKGDAGKDQLDGLEEYLQNGSIKELMENVMHDDITKHGEDMKTLRVFGKILEKQYAGDTGGGSKVLTELGKRIKLAALGQAVQYKQKTGKELGAQKVFTRKAEDYFEGKRVSRGYRKLLENASETTLPNRWHLGAELHTTPEAQERKQQLQEVFFGGEESEQRRHAWGAIKNKIDGTHDPDSVFARKAKEPGVQARARELTRKIAQGDLRPLEDTRKLSILDLKALRLVGIASLDIGYKKGEQRSFQDLSNDEKYAVRIGEIVGLTAEAEMLRRMHAAGRLDQRKAAKAYDRYEKYVRNQDIPDAVRDWFGGVEGMLREHYIDKAKAASEGGSQQIPTTRKSFQEGLAGALRKKQEAGLLSDEELGDLLHENAGGSEAQGVFYEDLVRWQKENPNSSFDAWKIAQAGNPAKLAELKHIVRQEGGVTAQAYWEKAHAQAKQEHAEKTENIKKLLQAWHEEHPKGSFNTWSLAQPVDAKALRELAAAERKDVADYWGEILGVEPIPRRPDAHGDMSLDESVARWQKDNPDSSFDAWRVAQMGNPEVLAEFERVAAQEGGMTAQEYWEKMRGDNSFLVSIKASKSDGPYMAWAKSVGDEERTRFIQIAKDKAMTPYELWDSLTKGEVRAVKRKRAAEGDVRKRTPEKKKKSPQFFEGKGLSFGHEKVLRKYQKNHQNKEWTSKYASYDTWVEGLSKDDKDVKTIIAAAEQLNMQPAELWERLKGNA